MIEISKAKAREFLLGHLQLNQFGFANDAAGLRALLEKLRCIQMDPLSPIATNHEMVALARVEDLAMADFYRFLFPGGAFEHYAKERCLLPAYAFPYYRDLDPLSAGRRLGERLSKVTAAVLDGVLAEVAEHGPLTPADLSDYGKVQPIDWSGWRGTAKAASMALEILWSRCQVVVCGRKGRDKTFDIPRRALPGIYAQQSGDFERWALLERIEAAGLLSTTTGPQWSMLTGTRTSPLPKALKMEGLIEEVVVEGSNRRFLAPAGFREFTFPEPDDHLRILAPLDPLLWDRKLIEQIFGFEYIWEVYKPPSTRRWGWYVYPILHRGHLVGRLEGRIRNQILEIDNLWREREHQIDRRALDPALLRHARACGAADFSRPRKFLIN